MNNGITNVIFGRLHECQAPQAPTSLLFVRQLASLTLPSIDGQLFQPVQI